MASIRKRNGKWQVQVRRQGQAPTAKTFHQKSDAVVWARHKERQADQGELVDTRQRLANVTLGDLVERYVDTIAIHKKAAMYERILLHAFLRHPICSKRLSELRTADFAAYRDERLTEIKPASLRRQLNPIRHLFEVARHEWGIPISENPLARIKLNGTDQRRERRLREGEEERIILAAEECRNPLVLPIIQLAIETAMRRGEILGIRSEHIDFEQRSLLIPHTKNGYARTIPLAPKACALLQSAGRGQGNLFPVTPTAFRMAWGRLRRRAQVDDLHFHDLRHEAISRFFEMGLTVPEVALISGHRDMRMLFRYAHPMRSRIGDKLSGGRRG